MDTLPLSDEIREGIYRIIIAQDYRDYSSLEQFDWERDLVGKLVSYLHSRNVVIQTKISRHLDDRDNSDTGFIYESLIEVEK